MIIALAVGWSSRVAFGEDLHLKLVTRDALEQRLSKGITGYREREQAIERLFAEAGCTVRMQPVEPWADNVICDLPGETSTAIVVGAHFDFINRGQGVVDDWSGAAMLPSLYETLHGQKNRHSYEFVAFTSEERGLLGSKEYVYRLTKTKSALPQAFVNLECLGMGKPKVWASRADPTLLRQLVMVSNALHISLEGVSVDRVGDDDSHPFLNKKIPVITIHSLNDQNFRILHSPRDRFDAINLSDYYDAYRLAAFYLKYLDAQLPADTTASEP